MLDANKIYEIYDFYREYFEQCMDELNKRNANDTWIIIESLKELDKNDKDYSITIRSNTQFDKNGLRILDKTMIAFTNSNINNIVQGITYLSTNLLGFVIHRENNKTFKIFVAFNGNIYESILIERE